MKGLLLFTAVSATLGVTAFFSLNIQFFVVCIGYAAYLHYRNGTKWFLFHLAIVLLFYLLSFTFENVNNTSFAGTEKDFLVQIDNIPNINGSSLRAFVKDDSGEKLQLTYKIQSEKEQHALKDHLQVGLYCRISGKLLQPENPRNENSFNYKNYLTHQTIHWELQAQKFSLKKCSMAELNIAQKLKNIRMEGMAYVEKHFPENVKGFAIALLFGDRNLIEEQYLTAYERLGIVHLLAISGLHVGILTGFLYYLGIRLGITRELMRVLMIIFLPIYIILSGASPSVLRSCFMAMLVFFALMFKWKIPINQTISAVYLGLLAYNPYMLFNIGFQLSFAVTCSIIMSSHILLRYQQRYLQMLIISIVSQLSSLPILLYHFFEVSMLGILLNVLYIPLYSTIFLPLVIIAFFIHLCSPSLAQPFLNGLDFSFYISNEAAVAAAKLPFSYLTFGKPSFWMLFVISVLILLFFVAWDQSGYGGSKKYVYILIAVLLVQFNSNKLSPYGEVTFIDVGQGDSILIRLPFDRGNYLIDTGGRMSFGQEAWREKRSQFDPGEDIVVPLLKSKGIRQLDKIIITHADADHAAGLTGILQEIKVEEIIIGLGSAEMHREKRFLEKAVAGSIPIVSVRRGDGWMVGQAKFAILNPYRNEREVNEASVVLYADIGGRTWLFTGDLGMEGELELIKTFPKMKADVLKVGHHGSKTSSSPEFLQAVQPRVSIISAGKDNRYGHPHSQVLQVHEAENVKVLRTDQDGAVIYRYSIFSKEKGTFTSVLP